MELPQASPNLAQIYSLSCQQIEEILKGLNASEYES
ncbi:unnamed protein product, partial [Rotaria magnacalcarata]